MEETAKTTLQEMRAQKKKVPGYGHPLHAGGDPRAIRLLELARERGLAGEHVAALETVWRLLPDFYGRTMFINVSGAIPAVMLDVGYPIAGLKGLPLLARTAGLIGHLVEDIGNPLGFLLAYHGGEAISYNGPVATE